MNSNIKLVVFDMAGTTVDEDNIVYKTIQKSLAEFGHNFTLEQVLTYCAGKEKRTAIFDILSHFSTTGETDENLVTDIFNFFRASLKSAYANLDVKTFKNTTEVFQNLKNASIKVVLNTGYDNKTATDLLNKLAWVSGREFDALITADDVSNGRPHPEMILLAMSKTGVTDPKTVIKIGDSCIDIEEGQAAGCIYSIGVTTGAQNKEELSKAKPDFIFDSLTELETLIMK